MIEYNISKKYLLSKISPEQIYSYYLNGSYCINKAIISPILPDKIPSFCLFYSYSNELIWKDFREGSGDCVTLISKLFKISYQQALNKIYGNFSTNCSINSTYLGVNSNSKSLKINTNKPSQKISYNSKVLQKEDLDYWGSYNIDINTLDLLNIKSADRVYYNSKLWLTASKLNPIYIYHGDLGTIKIYRPKVSNKRYKWSGNMKSNTILGLDLIEDNDLIILTKGYKDVGTLISLGYKAICFSSESVLLDSTLLDRIRAKSSRIFGLYDKDNTGISQLNNLKKFNIPGCYLEEKVKDRRCDISDLFKYYGKEYTVNKLKEILS